MLNHVLSINQFDKEEIDSLFSTALEFEKGNVKKIKNRILASLFFEPSTRTRLSFESAMLKIGGQVISIENGLENSSNKKGESIKDTIKTVENYADVLVIRHPEANVLEGCESYANATIINAGDGDNEHPTQNLIDLYTIFKHFPDPTNKTITFIGDILHSRTIHGLAFLLNKIYNMHTIYVVNNSISDVARRLTIQDNYRFVYEQNVGEWLDKTDIVYMTRTQSERDTKPSKSNKFILKKDYLNALKEDAIIMHPLPKNSEIELEIDEDHRAVYFKQARNGLFLRMALLYNILNYKL